MIAHAKASPARRIVLTGGPGAGKTAVLEFLRKAVCDCTVLLPEAAGIVFGGGFPRETSDGARRAAQRAIFFVQRELEAYAESRHAGIVMCDRGLADSVAYWPGPDDFWASIGESREAALARYYAVIHLRVPDENNGYGRQNPLRTESSDEARAIDERILAAWDGHPRRHVIPASSDFLGKVARTLEVLNAELPPACRQHLAKHLQLTPPPVPPQSVSVGAG